MAPDYNSKNKQRKKKGGEKGYSNRAQIGFPDGRFTEARARLRYVDYISLSTVANGVLGSYKYRANSIYDPDETGGGHQPMGRDLFAAWFNHYTVLGSTIKVTALPFGSENLDQACCFGVALNEDSSINNDYIFPLVEQGIIKDLKVFGSGAVKSGAVLPVSSNRYDPRTFLGIKDPIDEYTTIGAAIGSNPSEAVAFIICYQMMSVSAATQSIRFYVEIEYDVMFTEPVEQSQN